MEIIKKVMVKQVITHDSREKLYNGFTSRKSRLEQECQQLLFEQKKNERKHIQSKQSIISRYEQEIRKRREKINSIDFKIDQLDTLENGTEIVEKEVDAIVEVNIGMNWEDAMEQTAIVIKDGQVIRFD